MNSARLIRDLYDFESTLCRSWRRRSEPRERMIVPFYIACIRHLRQLYSEAQSQARNNRTA